MKPTFVYITAGNKAEAAAIGRELISSRLAACVNIIEHMTSMYRWQGEVKEDAEVVVIAKTVEAHIPALVEKVKTVHSYECPCIVSLPLAAGNKAFLDWIIDEVAER